MGILTKFKLHKVVRGLLPLTISLVVSFCTLAGIKETLSKKFPACQLSEESRFLSPKEYKEIQAKFPTKKVRKFYSFYKRKCGTNESFDFVFADIVRTKKQVVHIHIENSEVRELEVVRFEEPSEYRVQKKWLSKLRLNSSHLEDVDTVSGATLTSKSTKYLVWLSLYLQR